MGGTGAYADRSLHPFPDLVLLDLKLPKKPGLEVLGWMKSRPDMVNLPVFILSSSTEKSDVERAHSLGANRYLSKHGDMTKLVELVQGLTAYLGQTKVTEGSAQPGPLGGPSPGIDAG